MSKWNTSEIPWTNPDGVANISMAAAFSEARQALNERVAFYTNNLYTEDVPDPVNISDELDFWRSALPAVGYYYADLRKGEQDGDDMAAKCSDYAFLSSYTSRFSWNRRLTNADPQNPDEYTQGNFEFWQNMEEYLSEDLSRIHGNGVFIGGGSFNRPAIHTENDIVPADMLRQLRLIIQSFKILIISNDGTIKGINNWLHEVNKNDYQTNASHQTAFDELADAGHTNTAAEMNYTARTGLYASPDILRYNASISVVPSAEIDLSYKANLNKTINSPVSIYTIAYKPKDAWGIGTIPADDAIFDDLGTSQPEFTLKKFSAAMTAGVAATLTAWSGLSKSDFSAANPPYPETIIRGFQTDIAFALVDIDNATELDYYTP